MVERKSGHATGMAGEFFVMERLFRLGHEPALTLGNAKSIDIMVRTKSSSRKTVIVSVKATRGGGKWPVDKDDISSEEGLIFVLLLYKDFENLTTDPDVWIMPAPDVQSRKKPWFDKSAIYYSHSELAPKDLTDYKNAWHYIA